MIKSVHSFSLLLFLLVISFLAMPLDTFAGSKDKEEKVEMDKKRNDPDYILEKYTDIYKTTDYGSISIGPPFVNLKLAGIDYTSPVGRANLRTILKSEDIFPLRIYVVEKIPDRYNELCAVFVVPKQKTTVQELLIKKGYAKASERCLSKYPYYINKFKQTQEELENAQSQSQ